MTVMEVVERLRRAHELLGEAWRAVERAEEALVEGDSLFAVVTTGSTRPEVVGAAQCAAAALEDLRRSTGAIGGA
ncbi:MULTISPECIES: hypothetical protein [Actinoalloteichus]|uniref:Uncharacterized protein n=1 Tax=Actinoalloteichus fjordicus TaxID=1612552 RepID=A0AAC9LJ48_9PSEU|nr:MULTISPECIES: hypothetical protein [Actinoalloteichus]APU17264.1 hypothetical protein UA74_26295 [Actinoalloteichus fjordicus]APU23347.1 hypothetical protein UA75_26880 [Actinoalloteichus sp. GBA129-24]